MWGWKISASGRRFWQGELMTDLRSHRAMYLKAVLFLVIGFSGSALLLSDNFKWQTALVLALTIWAFCRAYYFAFYVIERYVDSRYRFSGLGSFVRYLITKNPPPS